MDELQKLHAGGGAAHSTTPALATGAILDSAARVDHLGALRKANPAFVSAAAVAEAERDVATLAALAEARPVPMRKSDGPSALTPPTVAEVAAAAAAGDAAWCARIQDRAVAAEIRRVRPRRIP